MKELSLNILDVAMNSVAAGATLVQILIDESQTGKMTLRIVDNGCGMDEQTLQPVSYTHLCDVSIHSRSVVFCSSGLLICGDVNCLSNQTLGKRIKRSKENCGYSENLTEGRGDTYGRAHGLSLIHI